MTRESVDGSMRAGASLVEDMKTKERIEFRVLGSPELKRPDGAEVRSVLSQPKRVGLLAYVGAQGIGSFVRRDELCAAFWPEAEQSQARHRLRTALHMLRRALGHEAVVGRGDEEIGLPAAAVWFDVDAFERAVDEGRHEDALELYRGDFLAGFHVSASHEFEDWLFRTRERLRRLAASSAKALAEAAATAGDLEAAVAWAGRAREIAPLDEQALRRHMDALDASGRRADALREYDRHAERSRAEIGADPAPETAALAEAIRDRTEPRDPEAALGAPGRGPASFADMAPSSGSRLPPAEGDREATPVPASSGRAAALTAALVLGGAAFFAARVAQTGSAGVPQPGGVSLLSYLGSWLILVVGLWFLFERAEETASPLGRRRVAAWLRPRDRRAAGEGSWADGFVDAFDRIFGPKHLSLYCLLRSMAASVVAVTILLLLWVAIRPEQFSAFAAGRGLRGLGELILITFLVNVVADYLSLLETRVALGVLRRRTSTAARAAVLVADALATLVVWLAFFAGLPFLALAGISSTANDIMLYLQFEVWSYAPTIHDVIGLSADGGGPPVGIWFYSTFLTSVWLWIYLGAGQIARAADATGSVVSRGLSAVAGTFDAERQPFRVLGFVAMILVTAGYGLGWLLNVLR